MYGFCGMKNTEDLSHNSWAESKRPLRNLPCLGLRIIIYVKERQRPHTRHVYRMGWLSLVSTKQPAAKIARKTTGLAYPHLWMEKHSLSEMIDIWKSLLHIPELLATSLPWSLICFTSLQIFPTCKDKTTWIWANGTHTFEVCQLAFVSSQV